MRHIKMFGLAVVAAMALMAIGGAGTASATVICKTVPVSGVCPEGWDYPAGTEGLASLKGTATLKTLGGTQLDTCTAGTVEGTSQNTGSGTTTINSILTALTWGGPLGIECTKLTRTVNPGTGELHWIPGTNNGTLTTRETQVTVNTIFGSCVYGTGAGIDMGTTIGGNPLSLAINTIVLKQGGNAACPVETRFTAEYVATSPTNAWVAER